MIRFLAMGRDEMFRLLACLFLGALMGAVIINTYTGRELDQLYYENRELLEELAAKEHRLERLEESLLDYRDPVIKEIAIEIESDEDKHMEQDIKKEVHSILKPLIGIEVDRIDGALLRQTLDERLIKVGDKSFEISMELVLLAPKTIFSIKAKRLPQRVEG